jgi:hypothetical protein
MADKINTQDRINEANRIAVLVDQLDAAVRIARRNAEGENSAYADRLDDLADSVGEACAQVSGLAYDAAL